MLYIFYTILNIDILIYQNSLNCMLEMADLYGMWIIPAESYFLKKAISKKKKKAISMKIP